LKYDLLIQIINYKTKDYLADCLESLFNDLGGMDINYKIIILDNASGDDLSEMENKYKNKNFSVHYSNVNYGFGGGHNFLSTTEDSEYILILNPDILFIEGSSIKRLYERIKKDREYAVIGPRLVVEDRTQQPFDHGELFGAIAWIKNNAAGACWRERNNESESAWVAGTVFLIRRDAFECVHGFDEIFFLYKEEEDLCLRLREKGYKVLYYPCVSVLHIGHVVAKRDLHFDNSMKYYIEKHFKNKLSYKVLSAIKSVRNKIIGEPK
jgi:N-acetylglucosaminyl-diphospho-decaprenol L-rhamnosyltransferase